MIDSGQHLVVLFLCYSPDDPAMEICSPSVGQLVLGGIVILPYNRFLYCFCHVRQIDLLSYMGCENEELIIVPFGYSSEEGPLITNYVPSVSGD